MNRARTYLFILVLLITTSCDKDDVFGCFKGTGKIVKETRNVGDFKGIIMRDNLDVILIQDNECLVEVEAGKNLQSDIKTINENGVLEVRNENGCNWVRSYDKPMRVYLHVKQLDSIEYRSSGDLITENTLQNDSIKLDIREGSGSIRLSLDTQKSRINQHFGTADVTVTGKSNVNFIYNASYGPVNCENLETVFTYMNTSSTNDCYVNVSYVLEVIISNAGNIYYRGNPTEIKQVVSGSGQLIRME
ncbi:MAG: DUF2807 domain-containing protein [Bacteroidetes bacterium]|nr:DUF2807 domain-containing protein [Bacteroidota bacterium]